MAIYLDNAATTPVAPAVMEAMASAMADAYGNPSSRHALGLAAERRLDRARQRIASHLAVAPDQLVLTSGGTEANALAVLGTARAQRRRHVLVSAIEHPSVLESAKLLEREGFGVELVPATRGGWVDPGEVDRRLRADTCLVAVMHVNNETGVRQPVEEIGELLRSGRVSSCRLLVDAVQSFTVVPASLDALGADLVTLSGHKIHGPKGIGCLALRPEIRLAPLWGGGDQEDGRRPGTENLPAAAGLARALELPPPSAPLGQLSELLLEEVRRRAPATYPLGDAVRRAPHILALAVPGVRAEVLLNLLEERGVVVSSGAACHSRRSLRSHVLEAMAVPREHGVIRVSLSRATTEDEIREAARIIGETVRDLG